MPAESYRGFLSVFYPIYFALTLIFQLLLAFLIIKHSPPTIHLLRGIMLLGCLFQVIMALLTFLNQTRIVTTKSPMEVWSYGYLQSPEPWLSYTVYQITEVSGKTTRVPGILVWRENWLQFIVADYSRHFLDNLRNFLPEISSGNWQGSEEVEHCQVVCQLLLPIIAICSENTYLISSEMALIIDFCDYDCQEPIVGHGNSGATEINQHISQSWCGFHNNFLCQIHKTSACLQLDSIHILLLLGANIEFVQ